MRRSMMAIVIAVNLFSAGGVSAAGNWDLRRNVGNGFLYSHRTVVRLADFLRRIRHARPHATMRRRVAQMTLET